MAAQSVPELPFESVPNPLTMPDDIHFGEIAGVAVNSKGHVFVFSRGNSTGPAYMATGGAAARVRSPTASSSARSARTSSRWSYAHAVRIDKQDNIWVVDKGSNMILKFNPQGRVEWVFGRKGESSHLDVPPDYASQLAGCSSAPGVPVTVPAEQQPAQPGAGASRQRLQPADRRGVGLEGQFVLQRRLRQLARRPRSTRAASGWRAGARSATAPAQFDTPHGIAVSPTDEIYVADRGNRRIQVFDTEGKFIREFTIDVPVDRPRGKIVYGAASAELPRPARRRPARPTRCA